MGSKFRWLGKADDGQTIVLRRFSGAFLAMEGKGKDWIDTNRARLKKAVVVDVETTGLNSATDTVIELAARELFYDESTGAIEWLGDRVTGLQDPDRPLPPEIVRLTGIRDEDVRGQAIDWAALERLIAGAELIVAHNAAFDRPFIERKCASAKRLPWGCSLTQIDWDAEGYPSRKLEVLGIYHGFFCDAHRAQGDVDALAHLLELSSAVSGKPYFAQILDNYRRPFVRVVAANSPFESKDCLKQRGYSWDTQNRYWHKKVAKDSLQAEIQWMEAEVYRGKFRGSYEAIPVERNFS